MGCFGDRERGPKEQSRRWEFITLSDFKCTSTGPFLAYAWLWFMAIVAVAVYAIDTFTAVNLLVFDKWSSQIQPQIAFKYSRWIFAICILISWALCFFEWIRAIRVIRGGGVAESYMDPLAVTLQSMRPQGWRRFLVFTELTKSKKGADYIAFFVYFAFKGAFRVILAEGPRQAVNAMTLYAVMQAKLIKQNGSTHSSIGQFFSNVQQLANENEEQAAILFSMLFTLVIWVFSALCLIAAGTLYILFLWHFIPQSDGRLSVYCRRKVDKRLDKIVDHKIKAAIEEENKAKEKAEKRAELKRQKTGDFKAPQPPKVARQPTLPQLGASPAFEQNDDKLPEFALNRQNTDSTVATLPLYSSRPPTRQGIQRQPTLPDLAAGSARPGMPSRAGTQGSGWSNASYDSNAPLLSNAGFAGHDGRIGSPAPTYSRQDSNASFSRRPLARTMTGNTRGSSAPLSRADTQTSQNTFSSSDSYQNRPPPGQRFPVRSNTAYSYDQEPQSAVSPISQTNVYGTLGPEAQGPYRQGPMRQDSNVSYFSRSTATPGPGMERRPTYGSVQSQQPSLVRSTPSPAPGLDRRPIDLGPYRSRAASPFGLSRNPSSEPTYPRAFSPLSAIASQDGSAVASDTYEMTSQPPRHNLPVNVARNDNKTPPSAATSYVAFKPPSPPQDAVPSQQDSTFHQPRRNITVSGVPGRTGRFSGSAHDLPLPLPPQRSATAPIDPRATTGYGDILDAYGHSATSSVYTSTTGFGHDSRDLGSLG